MGGVERRLWKRIGFFVVKATNRTPARTAESSHVQGPFLTDLIDQSPVRKHTFGRSETPPYWNEEGEAL